MAIGKWLAGLASGRSNAVNNTGETEASRSRAVDKLRRIADRETAWAAGQADRLTDARAARSLDTASAILQARRKPILFREIYPPTADGGMSFYGGVPVGPAGMTWPRGLADNRPLTFLMQWDAATLAAHDATGLLPAEGVLYLFGSLLWKEDMVFRFVHESGQPGDWKPLPVPDDLPAAWGDQAADASPFVSSQVPVDQQAAPRLLPRWPFAPLAIDYPEAADAQDETAAFWHDNVAVKELLIRAQDPDARLQLDPLAAQGSFKRPYPAFPHDWAAVRVIATAALDGRVQAWRWEKFAPHVDEAARPELIAEWRDVALALYKEAAAHPPQEVLVQSVSDSLWDRMRELELLLGPFNDVISDSVNVSLGLQSAGVPSIPASLIEAGAQRHSLGYAWLRPEYQHEFSKRTGAKDAVEKAKAAWRKSRSDEDMAQIQAIEREVSTAYERCKSNGDLMQVRETWAPTPNRMLGAPSYAQGYVEEYVDDRVLLLELTKSDAIGLRLGDGVLQFMIRSDDLSAKRFDRVEAVCSST